MNTMIKIYKVIGILSLVTLLSAWILPWDNYSSDEKEQISYFNKSHEFFLKSNKMRREIYSSNSSGNSDYLIISDSKQKKYLNALEQAYKYGSMVSESVLRKIHPELPLLYPRVYLSSIKNQSESIKEKDQRKQILSVELHNAWIDWFNNNNHQFKLR